MPVEPHARPRWERPVRTGAVQAIHQQGELVTQAADLGLVQAGSGADGAEGWPFAASLTGPVHQAAGDGGKKQALNLGEPVSLPRAPLASCPGIRPFLFLCLSFLSLISGVMRRKSMAIV